MENKIAVDIETQDPSPRWNNGRPELQARFYIPKDGEHLQIRFLKSNHEFRYPEYLDCVFDFADDREKKLVWLVFQQLGQVSYFMAYANAKGERSERTVTPVAMAFKNSYWGFFALCELKNDIRWFRFDRIQNLDPAPLSRPIPPMEISYRLVAMPPHERQAVLDALKVLDPEAYERCTDEGYRRVDGKQPRRKRRTLAEKLKEKHGKHERNYEDMTWDEWRAAAGIPVGQAEEVHKRAWRAAEDPTEWRAARENTRIEDMQARNYAGVSYKRKRAKRS